MFGLAGWTIERFVARRTRLHELQYAATRLRERSVVWSVLLVTAANVIVFWSIANAAASGQINLGAVVTFAQAVIGTSMIAFGGLNWALDGAAAPVGAVLRLEPAMSPAGALPSGHRAPTGMPARDIRFQRVSSMFNTSHSRSASPEASSTSTRNPFTPSSTKSAGPPMRVETTGARHAIASSAGRWKPSRRLAQSHASQLA